MTTNPPREDAREDSAYYQGAKQALAMAEQSMDAARKWVLDGCGGRASALAKALKAPPPPREDEPVVRRVWDCKIGAPEPLLLPSGADSPMRQAITKAFEEVTGQEPEFIFSGWGGILEECELAVVENRLPNPDVTAAHPPAKADDAELVEAMARIIAPYAFEHHARFLEHCRSNGDSEELALHYANATYGEEIEQAKKTAERILPLIQADRKAVRDAAVGEVVAMRQALVSLQDHAERTEALFKTRLGERTKPTWFAVNALQDFVGFVRMWSECDKARAAIASGEHEGAGE